MDPGSATARSAGFLVAWSIGPVSPWIDAARGPRDLWCGSYVLGQLAKAALEAAQAPPQGAKAVFPKINPLASSAGASMTAASLPNRAVVYWAGSADQSDVVSCLINPVRDAASQWLRTKAEQVAQAFSNGLPKHSNGNPFLRDVFMQDCNFDDLVEFSWAAVELDPASAYPSKYQELQQLLLAAKRTKTFAAYRDDPGSLKSTFDAARRAVVTPAYLSKYKAHQRRFGIDGESLDAPALLKRVLGRTQQIPAIPRIAIDPWLRALRSENVALLDSLQATYKSLCGEPVNVGSKTPGHDFFEFDGQLLLDDRIAAAESRLDKSDPEYERAQTLLGALTEARKNAVEALGGRRPDPYVAFLAVDIDRFGERLWKCSSMQEQQTLADGAAQFAAQLADRVKKHGGFVLYAGGDEALAVLPVDGVFACLAGLTGLVAQAFTGDQGALTVSAGVLLTHCLERFSSMRREVLEALAIAKDGLGPTDPRRNALAVVATPRSGAPIRVRGAWGGRHTASVDYSPLLTRLACWVDALHSKELPSRGPHLLSAAFDRCGGESKLLKAEMSKFVERRRDAGAAGRLPSWPDVAKKVLDGTDFHDEASPVGVAEAAQRLADEWRLARFLVEHEVHGADFSAAPIVGLVAAAVDEAPAADAQGA